VQSAEDYLLLDPALNERERVGRFYGSSFYALTNPDLRTEGFTPTRFHSLLSNVNPQTKDMIVHDNRITRTGFEVVLTPDKAISIAALCLDDRTKDRTRLAFNKAIESTIDLMESIVTPNHSRRPSLNLASSIFTHETSRWGDPHIHSHILIHNFCYDIKAKRWGCIEPIAISSNPRLIDYHFQRSLYENTRDLGIKSSWDKVKSVCTIDEVPQELRKEYSKGRGEVENYTAKNGKSVFSNLAVRPDKPPTPDFNSLIEPDTRNSISEAVATEPRKQPKQTPFAFVMHLAKQAGDRHNLSKRLKRIYRYAKLHRIGAGILQKAVSITAMKGFRAYSTSELNRKRAVAYSHLHHIQSQDSITPEIVTTPTKVLAPKVVARVSGGEPQQKNTKPSIRVIPKSVGTKSKPVSKPISTRKAPSGNQVGTKPVSTPKTVKPLPPIQKKTVIRRSPRI